MCSGYCYFCRRHAPFCSRGKTGILVKPTDVNALAEAIFWMLEHTEQAREMGLTGKRFMNFLPWTKW